MQKITDVICDMKKLTTLNLSWTCLKPKQMRIISEALKLNRNLRSLNLSYNSLTYVDMIQPNEDVEFTREEIMQNAY